MGSTDKLLEGKRKRNTSKGKKEKKKKIAFFCRVYALLYCGVREVIKVWPSLQGGLPYSKGVAACQKFLKKLQRGYKILVYGWGLKFYSTL